jgi:hypothetical protein
MPVQLFILFFSVLFNIPTDQAFLLHQQALVARLLIFPIFHPFLICLTLFSQLEHSSPLSKTYG